MQQKGFTLIEISIVLVIIGLLIGGILLGRDLIKAAELRAVITESGEFRTSIRVFKQKHYALPGDMATATTYFPDAAGNGTGNGLIDTPEEVFLVWQHLALAGVIPGSYTGVTAGGSVNHGIAGVNLPLSDFSPRSGYTLYWIKPHWLVPGSGYLHQGPMHAFEFGADTTNGTTWGPVLTPQQAYNIDSKIDDGTAGGGLTRPYDSSVMPGCSDNVNYLATNDSSIECGLLIGYKDIN